MVVQGYLGIDNGTQGLSCVLTDTSLRVIATGEGTYGFVEGSSEGEYEQRVEDWEAALVTAMQSIHEKIPDLQVLSIGISGQMHGEVLADESGRVLGPVRLWCDARNEDEGNELTDSFQVKIPKRATVARFLWTTRNRPEMAAKVRRMTTPAGWTAYRLTGEWNLGIGDAAGMFPIDQETLDYDKGMLEKFDSLVGNDSGNDSMPSIADILPTVRKAGEDAGSLNEVGATILGLPVGIPVAAAEGDQVAALAGSLIGKPGMISCGFGTSVCANVVGDRPFSGVSPLVDHYCTADGKPMLMVWLRNGTTFLNTVVESYGGMMMTLDDKKHEDSFARIMPQLVEAPADCGGLIALPFMDDEPGLNVSKGGSALIMGWNPENARVGNVAKAALLSTMFNLRLGIEVLEDQGYPRIELGLSGGLVKTPACGQILADVFSTPVSILESADEGSSWGAAVMAKFRHRRQDFADWPSFLDSVPRKHIRFEPDAENVSVYEKSFQLCHKKLIQLQPELTKVMSNNK